MMTVKQAREARVVGDPMSPENDHFTLSWLVCRLRGVKKTELIAETSISPASIAGWDRGLRLPNRGLMEKLLTGTQISVDQAYERQKRVYPHLVGKKRRVPAAEKLAVKVEKPRGKEQIVENAGLSFAAKEGEVGNALPVDDWEAV